MVARLLISEMHGLAGRAGELERLLENLAAAARDEDGCLKYLVLQRREAGEFVVVTHWRGGQGLRRHYDGAPHARHPAAVGGLLGPPKGVTVHHLGGAIHPVGPN